MCMFRTYSRLSDKPLLDLRLAAIIQTHNVRQDTLYQATSGDSYADKTEAGCNTMSFECESIVNKESQVLSTATAENR